MHLDLAKLRKEWKSFHRESERLSTRILALIEIKKLAMEGGHSYDWHYHFVGAKFKVSPRTVYRWKKAYVSGGIELLRPRKAPGKRKKIIGGWAAHHIKEMRLDFNWGAEVIGAHLLHDHNIVLSKWKINEFLRERRYIKRHRRRVKKNKHMKVVKVSEPGAHTQIDVKHLPKILRNGKKAYVYNFVDHASRWQFKMAFEGLGAFETVRFMEELLKVCPFKIKRLQSDHGSEFSYKHFYWSLPDEPTEHPLEKLCKQHGILKKLIPVGEKEVNGLVERSHRMDDEELYQTIRPLNITQFNRMLKKHVEWANNCRRRKPLNWKTAKEYLNDYTTQENMKAAEPSSNNEAA